MSIPTEKDWFTKYPECLDYMAAKKSFLGLSQEQAYKLFSSSALYYQEELNSMPKTPFEYYLKPFIDYLLSNDSKGDSDEANSFLGLLRWKIEYEPDMLKNVLSTMMSAAHNISSRQHFYSADESIYGNFISEYKNIERLAKKIKK